jgi:GDP-L-fucose synthase
VLYVDDQIEAILTADASFENMVLNCAANRPITIGQSAEAIIKAMRWNTGIVYPNGTFCGANRKILDSRKFLAATGWKPKISLDEGAVLLTENLKAAIG